MDNKKLDEVLNHIGLLYIVKTYYENKSEIEHIYNNLDDEGKKAKRKQKMSGKSSMWTCKILNNGRLFLEQIGKFA